MEIAEAKRRAQLGPRVMLARRGVALLISLISIFTVARLVTPEAYGLANMSLMTLAFAQVLRDFGMTTALMRKGTISQSELSFVFWLNSAITVGLVTILAAASPFIARFYSEPIVTWTILVALIGFLADGVTTQHRAMLQRDLRFGRLALIEIGALLAGFIVTLCLAFVYRNVWSIVIGNVMQLTVGAVAYLLSISWKPNRPALPENLGDLLRFGANTSIYSISTFLAGNAAPILIGRFLGASPLGQYNRAQLLFMMPTLNIVQPIAQTTLPLLARLRPHPEEYRTAYLDLLRRLCTFLMPSSVAIGICALPLVRTLLGSNWHDAGIVLSILMPALTFVGFGYAAGDLFVSQNRSRELRLLGILDMVIRIVAIGSGVLLGLTWAALGFTISSIVMAILKVVISGRNGPVSAVDQFRAGLPGVKLGVAAAIGALAGRIAAGAIALRDPGQVTVTLAAAAVVSLIVGMSAASTRAALFDLAAALGVRRFGLEPAHK